MMVTGRWQSEQIGTDNRWGSLYGSNLTSGASVVPSVSGNGFDVIVPALTGQTNTVTVAIRNAPFFRSSALRCGVPLRTENTGLESGATPMCRALDPTPHSAVTNITIRNQQSAIGNRYTFLGREIDWAAGLYYFRARWYDPETGRWLSKDPIGISGGLNQYVAFANNPVNVRDPLGLWNLWSPGTWGVANGIGWSWQDSINPLHESAGWSGAWEGAKGGAVAWADGVIPFADPFQSYYADECGNVSGDYKASQFFGGVSRDALLIAAGSRLASRSSSTLANSSRFGKGSQLFGRGGSFGSKGTFNQGPIRTGWGWKGSSSAGRDVFRTSWSKAGSRSYWNHLDWF